MADLRFKFDSNLNFGRVNITLCVVILLSRARKLVESLKNDFSKAVIPSITSGSTTSIWKSPPYFTARLVKCISNNYLLS